MSKDTEIHNRNKPENVAATIWHSQIESRFSAESPPTAKRSVSKNPNEYAWRGNTYIECDVAGKCTIQRGASIKQFSNRDEAVYADKDFRLAWRHLIGGAVALHKRQITRWDTHPLTPSYRVHTADFHVRDTGRAHLAIFTQTSSPQNENIYSIQVSFNNDRCHLSTHSLRDTRLFDIPFRSAARVFAII